MAEPEVKGYSGFDEIGTGGFATVYRARQDRLDRQVALKVLRAKDLDDATVRRFERECHAMGDLSWHPNVVGVFDSGVTTDGHPWLAMEYMARGSIADRVRQSGPLPWSEAVDIGVQVVGALGAVHAANRIHRDVKPENLLVGPFGEVKLADFGIAVGNDAASATAAQFTPGFVATEVLRGEQPDQRSDVYSLGATLHALIAGHSPFATQVGEPVSALLMRAIDGERPRLEGVPDDLADLVVQCLDTDPAARPQTATALGEALQAVQRANDVPVTVLRITAETDEVPAARTAAPDSSPTIVGGADRGDSSATIVGAVPGGDSSATIMGAAPIAAPEQPAPPTPPAPAPAPAPAPPAPASGAPSEKKGKGLLIGGGIAVVLLVVVGGAVALLSGGGDEGNDDRGFDGGVRDTIEVGSDPSGMAVDSNNLWVANTGDGTVSRVPLQDDEGEAAAIAVGPAPADVALSGDDVWVTNTGDDTVSRLSASSGQVVDTFDVGAAPGAVAALDDDVWVVNADGGSLSRIDAATGAITDVDVDGEPTAVALSENDVWVGTADNTVLQIDPSSNEVTQTIAVDGEAGIIDLAVANDTVWALDSAATITRIGVGSGDVAGDFTTVGTPVAIAAVGDEAFVANTTDKVIQRITAGDVVAVYDAGDQPENIAVSSSGLMFVTDPGNNSVLEVRPGD